METLQQKRDQVAGDMAALAAAVQAENRAFNPEENEKFAKLDAELQALDASIANLRRVEDLRNAAQARVTSVTEIPNTAAAQASATAFPRQGATSSTVTGGTPAAHNFQNHGFERGFGEYLLKVREAKTSGRVDPRLLINSVTTFGGESVGGDGGYLVPPQFQQGIMQLVVPQDSFLRALNPVTTNSNLLTIPADEDAPWGTAGITAAKTAEGGSITHSKPAFKKVNVVMHNVKSVVPVSNESLRDISFLSSYVQQKMASKLRWKVENYVVNGTGADQPRGLLNAPGILSLSSDIASDANTLAPEDLYMLAASAMQAPGGFWIVHPVVRAKLWALKSGSAGGPLFVMDATVAPKQSLLGEPLYVSEAAKPYNTAGDIIHVSPDGYVLAFEAGGIQQATSLEFAFDQDMTCFRATLRMGGEPTLSSVITRADGSTTTSNICVLAARS